MRTDEGCASRLPRSSAQFLELIKGEMDLWSIVTLPAAADDPFGRIRIVFWLARDKDRRAEVSAERGKLIIHLRPGGDSIDMERLHELRAVGWAWQWELRKKQWAVGEHIMFFDALERLLPPPSKARRSRV